MTGFEWEFLKIWLKNWHSINQSSWATQIEYSGAFVELMGRSKQYDVLKECRMRFHSLLHRLYVYVSVRWVDIFHVCGNFDKRPLNIPCSFFCSNDGDEHDSCAL